MGVIRLILPCKVCNEVGVVHKVSEFDVVGGELRSEWLRKACYGCRDLGKRDGKFRHGFNMLSRIESFEGVVRAKIAAEQVRVWGEAEVRVEEELRKLRGELCELGKWEYRESDPVCGECCKRDFFCVFRKEGGIVRVLREVRGGLKSLVVHGGLRDVKGQKGYLRERKRWERLLELPGLGLWGKHRNRKRLVSVVVYYGRERGGSDTKALVAALVRVGVLGEYEEVEVQLLKDEEVEGELTVVTVREVI